MVKNNGNVIGSWAFLIGFVLAVILGALGYVNTTWTSVLVVIGIIVGLLNVADKEAAPFLMSGVVLIIAAAFGQSIVGSIGWIDGILTALLAIFVPATIIVAIRNVFSIAKR